MSGGADFVHESVLPGEVLQYLSPQKDKVYVDGTLGGAGHASAIVGTGARLIGIDRDPAALAAAAARFQAAGISPADQSDAQVRLIHGEFGDAGALLAARGITQVDGLLLDLGVSSPQLDHAERGFSFMKEGPLDMRMDPTKGPTALDLLTDLDADELAEVIRHLGEERHAKKIARDVTPAPVIVSDRWFRATI